MADLVKKASPGNTHDLTFKRDGTGTLHYMTRLRYASTETHQQSLDRGFGIDRKYAVMTDKTDEVPATSFKAGDLIRVTLTFELTKERRYVAVSDPLPAGFEPVESWFATTAADLGRDAVQEGEGHERTWRDWWERGGFDHVERFDDRVQLFATRLGEGRHVFWYVVRATTAGTFITAPAHVEEMYAPEVFGRTATAVIAVNK